MLLGSKVKAKVLRTLFGIKTVGVFVFLGSRS